MIPAVAYHFCLNLAEAFTQPGQSLLTEVSMYIHLGLSFHDSYNLGCNSVEFSICEPFERHSHGVWMAHFHPLLFVRMLLALIQYTTRTEGIVRLGFALLVPRRARSQRLIHPTQPVRELGEILSALVGRMINQSVRMCTNARIRAYHRVLLSLLVLRCHWLLRLMNIIGTP